MPPPSTVDCWRRLGLEQDRHAVLSTTRSQHHSFLNLLMRFWNTIITSARRYRCSTTCSWSEICDADDEDVEMDFENSEMLGGSITDDDWWWHWWSVNKTSIILCTTLLLLDTCLALTFSSVAFNILYFISGGPFVILLVLPLTTIAI